MSATSRVSALGIAGRCSGAARKLGGADSPMVELSQAFSAMPARRAAASALSRTDGSMPSTLHDTREFMLRSGSDSGAHPAPTASPRVPLKRQSNSAQVVCLRDRLFRVTVNNGLRSWAWGLKNWLPDQIQPGWCGTARTLSQWLPWTPLGPPVPSKVFFGTSRLL